jgi:hypothetical protein
LTHTPEEKPWCSTKVDYEDNHVPDGGFWGDCDQECNQTQLEIYKAKLTHKNGKLWTVKGYVKPSLTFYHVIN